MSKRLTKTENLLQNIRNENDPEYDEDAAVCQCGHTFRDHCGRAFGYQCALAECDCTAFYSAPVTSSGGAERSPGVVPEGTRETKT